MLFGRFILGSGASHAASATQATPASGPPRGADPRSSCVKGVEGTASSQPGEVVAPKGDHDAASCPRRVFAAAANRAEAAAASKGVHGSESVAL